MAFCNKCGAQIPDGANVCPNCGTSQSQQTQPPNVYVSPNPNPNYAQYQGNDHTAEFDPQDVADNKVMAVLAYIGFLFLIPLLAAPQSKFARFHTNQGLVLFIVDGYMRCDHGHFGRNIVTCSRTRSSCYDR